MENIEQLIDNLHLEDLRNELHPSVFDENEDYDMLIVRLPVILEVLDAKSIGFVLTKQNSYIYNKDTKIFEELIGKFEGPYKIIDKLTDRVLKSFVQYQDNIADMEELLYKNNIKEDFMNKWLSLKLDILRIERILLRTAGVIDDFMEHNKDIPEFPINHYVDIHEHLERTMRSATLQLSKLDYLYSFYNAKSNEKMNRMLYILTIISAIFLPLNLVVGFFGMNTSSLPFTQAPSGTYYAISIMMTLLIITSLTLYKWHKKI
ncbi:Mg2+ transporter protein, CorA-like protein [Sulfurimonas gotlandica GD1]|uniref:Mg2+ transporter protein, CorA-like protein n=1 Tax=Sulfurimonas gotlandica (strain DSM 19862 / JCM 16533 / GD1) TaxID=929558 RepID=B6BJC4_SULGG|nr:CorA family divalent cation transporter [Sulfurimonas gotlandica]EDZ63108.1 CorA-like Mg2+ transporter protein [Sulfurimonas gotlandica GD1]EHP30646.1 Mg2+ transporter protein, CorA-like protein [Sulfurimonas gotlandica GD1]